MAAKPKGDYKIRKQAPRKRTTPEGQSYVIPYVGPYAALEPSAPQIGTSMPGFPGDYLVAEVSLEETGGGSGRMVVTIEKPSPAPSGPSAAELADPIYESDYQEEQRPLEENKKCGKLKPDRPYYEYPDRKKSAGNPAKSASQADSDLEKVHKQRTWDHWQSLDADDYELSTATGNWDLATYKSLREAGFTTYPINLPVCTATTYHRFRPGGTGGINSLSTPPSECGAPSGYVYVKTGDRVTKQGRLYTRVRSWKGYPPGTRDEVFIS